MATGNGEVRLRRIPYPYKAMLAICSDLDETPDWRTYWEIMRFLNTTETTLMGPGVGLEVGNSIYFDMPRNQFAYWNTDDAGREMVRTLIRSGHIDCLHSYGDLATTRAHAGQALEELDRHGCRLEVWVDHSKAATNFGADIMHGQGDVPGSPAYHADLTCGYGIRYVSRGRVTSMIGQDVPASLSGLFTPRHPVASAKTAAKEAAKRFLARHGDDKYAMHGLNKTLQVVSLRDGRPVNEFIRSDPYWGGVGEGGTPTRLAEVLTKSFLDRLVDREGVCVFYTHLGKITDRNKLFGFPTRNAFRLLAEYGRDGRILVTTTRRLLDYLTTRDALRFRCERAGETLSITVESVEDAVGGTRRCSPEELAGITFVAERCAAATIRTPGHAVMPCQITPYRNKAYITIPWRSLEFPDR